MEAAVLNLTDYIKIKHEIIERGYIKDILWYTRRKPCPDAEAFATQAIWVVLCAGMKEQIARIIEKRVWTAIMDGGRIDLVFHHRGKAKAIEHIWKNKENLFQEFSNAEDKLEYLVTLPWIGDITKFHLAKNLGLDVCKPDRHLVRIASKYGMDPDTLCQQLAKGSGDRISVVDVVLWRAGNLGMI